MTPEELRAQCFPQLSQPTTWDLDPDAIEQQGEFGGDGSPAQEPHKLQKLNDRHRVAAHMQIGGATNKAICEQMGWNPSYFSQLIHDPIFVLLKQDLQKEFRENSLMELQDKVAAASTDTFNTINGIMLDKDAPKTARLTAAFGFLDRQLPKVSHAENDTKVVIQIDGFAEGIEAMRDAAGIDAKEFARLTVEQQTDLLDSKLKEPLLLPEHKVIGGV